MTTVQGTTGGEMRMVGRLRNAGMPGTAVGGVWMAGGEDDTRWPQAVRAANCARSARWARWARSAGIAVVRAVPVAVRPAGRGTWAAG